MHFCVISQAFPTFACRLYSGPGLICQTSWRRNGLQPTCYFFCERYKHAHIHVHVCVYLHTHTRIYIYIYIHTHTHTCIHIWCSPSCKQFPLDFAVLEYFLWAKEHSDARLMNLSSPWMGDFPDSACLNSSSKKHHGISRFHPPCCWLVSWIGCVSCQTFEHCNSCHITWRIQSASHRSVPSSIFGSPGAEIVFLLQCFDLKLVKL